MNNVTEGSLRNAIVNGRKLARSEFARVLKMVHRAQQAENNSCGAHGPATILHKFSWVSREGKAIGSMRGYSVLAKRLRVVDHDDLGVVEVSAWS